MKKSLKFSGIIGILALILLLGVAVLAVRFDPEQYKSQLVSLAEQRLERDISVQGDIRLALSLFPTIVLEDATLGNAPWSEEPVMLTVGRAETRIALLPLLSGNFVIQQVSLREPRILVETGPEGVSNWHFPALAGDSESTMPGGSPFIDIQAVSVENARIDYIGSSDAEPRVFTIKALNIESAGSGEQLDIRLEADYNGLPLKFTGQAGTLAQWRADTPYLLDLDVESGPLTGRLSASLAGPAGLNGELSLAAESLAAFNSDADSRWPDIGPLSIRVGFDGDRQALDMETLEIDLADSDIRGQMQWVLTGERPQVTAELTSNRLDLKPFAAEGDAPDERLFSTAEFDTGPLSLVDADIEWTIGKLLTRSVVLDSLKLPISLKRDRLTLTPRGGIAGGTLDAGIDLDSRPARPDVSIRLDINAMRPAQLPLFQEKPVIRDGPTDIHFEGRGSGNSVAAIAAGMNGRFVVTVGEGELLNEHADLAGSDLVFSAFRLLNPLANHDNRSRLVCGVLNFTITDGVAQSSNGIALQTDRVNVLGGGAVDLSSEALDIRAKPRAREGIGVNIAQLADVVKIGGTLKRPRAVADAAGAAQTAGTVGAAIATGGLSLLAQGLYSRTFSTNDPCGAALGNNGGKPDTDGDDSAIKRMFDGLLGR